MRYLAAFALTLGSLGGCQKNPQADPRTDPAIPSAQNGGHDGLLVTKSSPPGGTRQAF